MIGLLIYCGTLKMIPYSPAGFPVFKEENLKWPGFVEFDDVNAKVLTYSHCKADMQQR